MSELLKKQNYGVEVEFTGISRKMAADAVAEIIGTTASRPDHTCYQTRTIQDSQGRKWKVMRDSSINPIRKVGTENTDEYRVEFVTPVLKYEDLDTLQAIIRKFREIGGVPHASCGIHIHVDGANHTATSLRRLVNFMYSRQEIIYDALAVFQSFSILSNGNTGPAECLHFFIICLLYLELSFCYLRLIVRFVPYFHYFIECFHFSPSHTSPHIYSAGVMVE